MQEEEAASVSPLAFSCQALRPHDFCRFTAPTFFSLVDTTWQEHFNRSPWFSWKCNSSFSNCFRDDRCTTWQQSSVWQLKLPRVGKFGCKKVKVWRKTVFQLFALHILGVVLPGSLLCWRPKLRLGIICHADCASSSRKMKCPPTRCAPPHCHVSHLAFPLVFLLIPNNCYDRKLKSAAQC